MEVESPEFRQTETKRTVTQRVFDLAIKSFNYMALISGILWIVWYFFNLTNFSIGGLKFTVILILVFFYFGSLGLISTFMRFVCFISRKFGENIYVKVDCAHRWISLGLWYGLNLYFIQFVEVELGDSLHVFKAYLQSGLLTSISFVVVSVAMEFFYESFVEKSLYCKLRDVEMSERILAAMKNYRYELSESSSVVSRECTFGDLFFFKDESDDENDEHIALKRKDKRVGSLYLKVPELQSLYDAKTLGRDVFEKAANGAETLNFDCFATIFPNDQIALQAFPYFESSGNHEILKKDFRDTLVQFYVDRINLEKSFEIAKGFVAIIGDIFTIIVSALLILAYLVIFGIPIRELLALALSSAFLLNFLVSGAATDIYYNILILLTHPFDVGDEVVIDDTDFRVYKIGLTSTSFIAPNGGKVKFINSNLWKSTLINMTRAPEKILIFDFILSPDIDVIKFQLLKNKLQKYLRERSYDFFETFSMESISEAATTVDKLKCRLVLRCKNYKTRAKKFALRIELTKVINELIAALDIKLA